MRNFNPLLYFITDSNGFTEEEFLKVIEEAVLGGVTMLQIREKDADTRKYINLAEKVHKITKKYNVPLIIDDRIDVALAVGAEGVHLGESDMPIGLARKILGGSFIIGATAKTVTKAKEAVDAGADYLGVGAIYPTQTKVKTKLTSVETLKEICNQVNVPVNAIGGLNIDNIDILAKSGISGICVVSAIMKSPDPRNYAKALKISARELI